MNIGIIGATGKAGSRIMAEAMERGHQVTAIVRDASKLADLSTPRVLEKDVFQLTADDLRAFDVVVNAFGAAPGSEHLHVEAGRALIEELKDAPKTRLIVVGGAGSLFADEQGTVRVMDTPDFPAEYLPTAKNQGQNLEDLRASSINWTFISPSAFFDPEGPRTGKYVTGKDQLLINAAGQSYVSYADYAIAVVDEIEQSRHVNERFTVGSESK